MHVYNTNIVYMQLIALGSIAVAIFNDARLSAVVWRDYVWHPLLLIRHSVLTSLYWECGSYSTACGMTTHTSVLGAGAWLCCSIPPTLHLHSTVTDEQGHSLSAGRVRVSQRARDSIYMYMQYTSFKKQFCNLQQARMKYIMLYTCIINFIRDTCIYNKW